jgi:alkyl hydroperoxide reductase subunit AhpF
MPSHAATCGVEGCSVGGNRYDVMVIGGGHNGLTSVAYLARAGLSSFPACDVTGASKPE